MDQTEILGNEIARTKTKVAYFIRFNVRQRIEHLVLMLSFIVLAVTGLAEKFYTGSWASWLIMNFGGIAMTRFIHRAFGVLFIMTIVYHFAYLIYDLGLKKNPASMLPTMNDVKNILESFKYTFGFRDNHILNGRYDYRQKFEYWGIVFGGLIMASTGLVLIYPTLVTEFLPGQIVAAARTMHGNEAMLAVSTIVIWHLYDTILKPGIFPLDVSIFNGKISEKRMEEEHILEYQEMLKKSSSKIKLDHSETPAESAGAPEGTSNKEEQGLEKEG